MDLWVKPVILNPSTVTLEPFVCHSERSEESRSIAQDKLREESQDKLREGSKIAQRFFAGACPEQSLRFFGSASE
jgi:hypothetical protein